MENTPARNSLSKLLAQKAEAVALLDSITKETERVAQEIATTEGKTTFEFEGRWFQIRKGNGNGTQKLYVLATPPKGRPRGSKNKTKNDAPVSTE